MAADVFYYSKPTRRVLLISVFLILTWLNVGIKGIIFLLFGGREARDQPLDSDGIR